MRQLFTYSVNVPAEAVVDLVQERIQLAIDRAVRLDRHMDSASVEHHEDTTKFIIKIQYKGVDRWWVSKRVRFAMAALLAKAKVPASSVELVTVQILPDKRALKAPERNPNSGPKSTLRRWEELQEKRAANASEAASGGT